MEAWSLKCNRLGSHGIIMAPPGWFVSKTRVNSSYWVTGRNVKVDASPFLHLSLPDDTKSTQEKGFLPTIATGRPSTVSESTGKRGEAEDDPYSWKTSEYYRSMTSLVLERSKTTDSWVSTFCSCSVFFIKFKPTYRKEWPRAWW